MLVTYISMESVAVEIPRVEQFDRFALILCPLITVRQGSIQSKNSNGKSHKKNSHGAAYLRMSLQSKGGDSVGGKIEDLAHGHDGKVQGRKVVM